VKKPGKASSVSSANPMRKAKPAARLARFRPAAKVAFAPCSSTEDATAHGAIRPGAEGLVAHKYWMWPNGSRLHVYFLDGSLAAREAVAKTASQWTEHANIDLEFHLDDTRTTPADIVVTFEDSACNSSVGWGSRNSIAQGRVSMRLCHKDKEIGTKRFSRVVLHEFGHALGLKHEHESPNAAFQWDKAFVYDYYARTNGWSATDVDDNLFDKLRQDEARATEWDKDSIMQYFFPPEFTFDRVTAPGATDLSQLDKEFIAEVYPGRSKSKKKPKPTPVPKAAHFVERRVILRNDTSEDLVVDLVVEKATKGQWNWSPSADVDQGTAFAIAAGKELTLPHATRGRFAKARARSKDAARTWSDHAVAAVELAPPEGYDDRAMQLTVIAISGLPDGAPTISRDTLWEHGQTALDAGRFAEARELFGDFTKTFPKDPWLPFALLNVGIAFLEEGLLYDAASSFYDLIIGYPESSASLYAWYYGGVAATRRGGCHDARYYFSVAADPVYGLSKAWTDAATEYLEAIDAPSSKWCAG